jgi:NitT/TauT family transport system substrate-binding protein/putative hydroxymethylpyrimidine transport system substrate-binding protein
VRRLLLLACLAAALAVAVAGCGGSNGASKPGEPARVVLALDFTPNAVHAPIFEAVHRGSDRAHGVRLDVRVPGSGPDAVKLVASGKVDLGILDIQDLAIARERGIDLVGIGALVRRPLAALIAQPEIRRPRDLEGRRVGVSGLPSDPAFLRAILEHDGADYRAVKQVTVGFNAVGVLLSHKVAAVPAFWNAEGVALRRHGLPVQEFRIEDYGAPPYPEVVLMTSRRTLERHRDRLKRTLAAIEDGRRATLARPDEAVRTIARLAEARDTGLVRAQLDAVAGAFSPRLRLDRQVLERWASFDARIGIVQRRPDVAHAFDFTMTP